MATGTNGEELECFVDKDGIVYYKVADSWVRAYSNTIVIETT
jgi:hypothetical protein